MSPKHEMNNSNKEGLIKNLIKRARRSITAYVIKQYYKEFDAEAYNIYYNQPHMEGLREEIATNFIEFDCESFDNMPTYSKPCNQLK